MENRVRSSLDLKEAIDELKEKQSASWLDIKSQLLEHLEDIKPVNLLSDSIGEFTKAGAIKEKLTGSLVSLAAGFLLKKIVVGSSRNPIKQILGSVIQIMVSGVVYKNSKSVLHSNEH